MPKQKTHKGAAKRFDLTKSGKVKRAQAFKRHILTQGPPSAPATCARLRISPALKARP